MKGFILVLLLVLSPTFVLTEGQPAAANPPHPQAAANSTHTEEKVQYTPDDKDYIGTKMDPVIMKEIQEAKKVLVNREHSQHYGFLVEPAIVQQFVFAVDVDEEMEAMIVVYWEKDDTYLPSSVVTGEEVEVKVFEDGRRLVGSWSFYHAAGISFHAKKEHQYFLKVISKGKNKMLVMDVQNFVYKGSSHDIARGAHVEAHQQKMKGLKQKLQSFLTITETNHIVNELIAENVRLHMNRYMVYEVIEGLIIFGFALAQGYYIRKLLSKGYSIV